LIVSVWRRHFLPSSKPERGSDMLGTGLELAPHPARSSAAHNNPTLQAAGEAARSADLSWSNFSAGILVQRLQAPHGRNELRKTSLIVASLLPLQSAASSSQTRIKAEPKPRPSLPVHVSFPSAQIVRPPNCHAGQTAVPTLVVSTRPDRGRTLPFLHLGNRVVRLRHGKALGESP